MTRRKRKPRPCAAPTMVLIQITHLELHERLSVQAFVGGWANTEHFDNLADCHDLLNLAAADKRDQATLEVCDISGIALFNIKDRYAETGRFGVTGEEHKALELLADTSKDFWSRQAGTFFHQTYMALKRLRAIQKEKRAQEKAA
ncbi:hypothetical protein [Denitromonas sp.]|uniref:hypothetical protein n=1 Tax=Denitromonas sp. TaxID=2734609 RepID=UPI003A8BE3C8